MRYYQDAFKNMPRQDWTQGVVSYTWNADGSLHISSGGQVVTTIAQAQQLFHSNKMPDWLMPGKQYCFKRSSGSFSVGLSIGDVSFSLHDGDIIVFDGDENTSVSIRISVSFQPGQAVDTTIDFHLYEVVRMNKASNVTVGKPKITGGIYRAPIGTTLPTDAISTLGEAFESLGYIAEGGVENNFSTESDSYRAWGGDIVLVYSTGTTDTFAFGMIETIGNEAVQKTWFGDDNVSGTLETGMVSRANAADLDDSVYVIDMTLRGGVLRRIVIPNGKLTERGAVTYEDENAVVYPATITAQAGSDGDTHKEYTQSPA